MSRGEVAPIKGFAASFINEPDGVGLTRSPLVMAANEALSPNQLEARIEVYAELARQRLPLFESGSPQDDGNDYRCWGCGAFTPLQENGRRMMPHKAPGWVLEKRLTKGVRPKSVNAVCCPECAAMPGFGCVEEEEPAEAPVSLR